MSATKQLIDFLLPITLDKKLKTSSKARTEESTSWMEIKEKLKNKSNMNNIYNWAEKIHEGKRSIVMRGIRFDGEHIIGKFLKLKSEDRLLPVVNEVYNHRQLLLGTPIPGVVNLLDFFMNNEHLVVIVEPELELCEPKTEKEIRECFRQLLYTLNMIHNRGFIHHDIKRSNIMYHQKYKMIQLIDFGLSTSTEFNSCDHYERVPGTDGYKPTFDNDCSPAFDIYCCGSVLDKWYRAVIIPLTGNARDLAERCWQTNYKKRPTAAEALTHPYFREI